MTGHSQHHSISDCNNEVIGYGILLLSPSSLSKNIFLRKIVLAVYVAAHEALELLTGFICKHRKPAFLSTSLWLPTGSWGGTIPSFTQIWLSFVLWVKAIVAVSFKVCFFLPWFQFLYVASCLCVAEAAQAFVLQQCWMWSTRGRWIQRKPLFDNSNYEQYLGWYYSWPFFFRFVWAFSRPCRKICQIICTELTIKH